MSTTLSPVTPSAGLHLDFSWAAPSTARVAVRGAIDLGTAHLLRDRLLDVLREHRPALLVVDLAAVTFLDCSGIGALVAVRNAALRAGHQVRIRHPQPIVGRILDVTGLLGVLTAPTDRSHPRAATDPPGVLSAV